MRTRKGRMIFLTLVLSAIVWIGTVYEGVPFCQGSNPSSSGNSRKNGNPETGRDGTVNEMMAALRALIIDFAGYNACDRINGRYIPLSSGGSSSRSGKKTNAGVIRIDSCHTGQVDPNHLRIELSGIGWQWISRKKEKLGATFTVNDYAAFNVKISITGTFDMAYDRKDHILTIWFIPTQPVDANLRVLRNVDVDTESLWSSIVGAAGSLIGKSPEQRAEKTISRQGDRMFQSKLSQGLTLIMDLCTGSHYFKLGSFPSGQLPESASRERKYLVNSTGIIHERGVLMAGPFGSESPVVARITPSQGVVEASIVCEESAKRIADAYVNGEALPDVGSLAEETARPGKPATLKVKAGPGCKVVLVMRPSKGQKGSLSFDYMAYHEGEKPKPFVDCVR